MVTGDELLFFASSLVFVSNLLSDKQERKIWRPSVGAQISTGKGGLLQQQIQRGFLLIESISFLCNYFPFIHQHTLYTVTEIEIFLQKHMFFTHINFFSNEISFIQDAISFKKGWIFSWNLKWKFSDLFFHLKNVIFDH